MGGAAVLDDAQAPGRDLLVHAVVEQDHAVGNVFFQALARERALAALAGDERGHALVLQVAEQAPQLRAQQRLVGEAAEQRLDRVEHDTLPAHRVDGEAEPEEQPLEVVLAGLVDLRALDAHVIDRELLFLDQAIEIEAERAHVLRQFFPRLLEADEDAGLAELRRTAHQELGREQRLAAARAAADQRRPASRQAAVGNFVQTVNTGRRFG